MISQQSKPNNSFTNYPSKKPIRKHATLAQCIKVGGARGARATVLQKLCHYYAGARFEIDGQKMTAPTTGMLMEELGLSRSTIQKAIRDLERMYVIEVKMQHFNRSPRRYILVLINPADVEIEPQKPKPKALSGPAPTSHEPMTGPDDQTVHIKKEKKKKTQKKIQPIQGKKQSTLRKLFQGKSGESHLLADTRVGSEAKRHFYVPRDSESQGTDETRISVEKTSDDAIRYSANSSAPLSLSTLPDSRLLDRQARRIAEVAAVNISLRRGWTNYERASWQERYVHRLVREHLRWCANSILTRPSDPNQT